MSESNAGPSGSTSSKQAANPTSEAPEHVTAASATIDDAPDPDEDDLDDLDDMLDEFSTVKLDSKKSESISGPGRPPATISNAEPAPAAPAVDTNALGIQDDDFSEEEFQKQLQAGMEELMGDLDKNPEMQAQFESIFKELGAAAAAGTEEPAAPSSSSSSKPPADSRPTEKVAEDLSTNASFQDTIRRTMARMQASGDQATAEAAAQGSEEDFIAEMMKAMGDLPAGEGSEEDFTKMLMGMMEQLTNKEILYEPMKELNDKFPEWMEKNKATLKQEDLKRYEEQQIHVKEMVAKFEEPTYKDSNVADREYIVERMQKMQAAGAPPPDLVGDMPSAKEVLDAPDESCAPQ